MRGVLLASLLLTLFPAMAATGAVAHASPASLDGSKDGRAVMPPLSAHMEPKPGSYEQACFEFWSGQGTNTPTAALIELVTQALADPNGRALVAATEGGEMKEVRSAANAIGFVEAADGALQASPELLQALLREQNRGRSRAHALAEAKRRQLLDRTLAELFLQKSSQDRAGDSTTALRSPLHPARAHGNSPLVTASESSLRRFCAAHAPQPASWPVLHGVRSLLHTQSRSDGEQVWLCSRDTLLNGGDAFVRPVLTLLHDLHFQLVMGSGAVRTAGTSDAVAMEEGTCNDELHWVLQSGVWSAAELSALAAVVSREISRVGASAVGGKVVESGRRFEVRVTRDWRAWLLTLCRAWYVRFF